LGDPIPLQNPRDAHLKQQRPPQFAVAEHPPEQSVACE
jgi:hypothetical protein